jgi:hypothetical protein
MFYVGQKVICTRQDNWEFSEPVNFDGQLPCLGGVYEVTDVLPGGNPPETYLILKGVVPTSGGSRWGFLASCFQPLAKTASADFIDTPASIDHGEAGADPRDRPTL